MKKSPFCAEEIQDDAIKCKHCGEWINKTNIPFVSDKDEEKEIDKVTQAIITDAQAKQKGFGWGNFWIFMGFLRVPNFTQNSVKLQVVNLLLCPDLFFRGGIS